MSFKPEVRTSITDPKFYGNTLAFATYEEAQANVLDLQQRWFLVVETRVVESDQPVNYVWANGMLAPVRKAKE